MSDLVAALFERELERRGVSYSFDRQANCYRVQSGDGEASVSIDNLRRAYDLDRDEGHVTHFVDSVLSARIDDLPWEQVQGAILFTVEPSDYVNPSEMRLPLSERVDMVPVLLDVARNTITWISFSMVGAWKVPITDVGDAALRNLAAQLEAAKLEYADIDGVRLGYFESELALKSSLILAPNLREVVAPVIGWPVYAVIPERDFLYLWATRHTDFTGRLGEVVVKVFNSSPYPLTTEVFEISDHGIKAIGAFALD